MKKTLLVVESQPDMRRLLSMTLDFGDYDLHVAEDAVRGLYLARGLRPSLVVLDSAQGGALSGLELCARIRDDSALAHTRIILLTEPDQREQAAALADACLDKPFSPLELLDTVERLWPQRGAAAAGYDLNPV